MNVAIIGTSPITEHHINAFKSNGIKISLISSTRKDSKLLPYLVKKYKISSSFNDWKKAIKRISKNKIKIDFFLISGRFKDNKKILIECLKFNKRIFIEKPIFSKSKSFNFLLKYKKNIFVGYNRTKFKNIIYLKNLLKKKKDISCVVKIPEKNKKLFYLNSCHIISVLKFIFGDMKIVFKSKNCIVVKNSKVIINILVNFSNSDNFSIEIFNKKKRYLLCPLETLKIYEKLKSKKFGINRIFLPEIKIIKKEKLVSRFKPGFIQQTKDLIKFIKTGKIPKENSLKFAIEIVKFSERIFA